VVKGGKFVKCELDGARDILNVQILFKEAGRRGK
jgi:hypothetical protein